MAWVRVDDRMARGPKVKRAAAALGGKFPRRRVLAVWLEAMSYCNLNTTDGFIPDFEVVDIEDERAADVFAAMAKGDQTLGAIVERDETRGGWVFRNYFEYQPSKASIEEKTEHERKRKANARAKKARPVVVQECPTGTHQDGADVSALPDPIRPVPDRSVPNTHADRDRPDTEATTPPVWRASEPKLSALVPPRARHARCYDAPAACARGLCLPQFLGAQWEAQLGAGQPEIYSASAAVIARVNAIVDAVEPGTTVADPLPWWREQWKAHETTRTSGPSPAAHRGRNSWDDAVEALLDRLGLERFFRAAWFRHATLDGDLLTVLPESVEWIEHTYLARLTEAHGAPLRVVALEDAEVPA